MGRATGRAIGRGIGLAIGRGIGRAAGRATGRGAALGRWRCAEISLIAASVACEGAAGSKLSELAMPAIANACFNPSLMNASLDTVRHG
jgi:hypothetical protein